MVKKAWFFQGEGSFHFFVTRVYEIYQGATNEIKSYIVFIYFRLIQTGVLKIDPEIEYVENYFFLNFQSDGINLRGLSIYLLQNTICIEDLKDVIQSHIILGEELYTEEYTLILIKVLEKTLTIIVKKNNFKKIFKKFLRVTYKLLYKILEIFGEDGDFLEERKPAYFQARKKLLQILVFFHFLGFGSIEEIKQSFELTFQNTKSKNFKLYHSISYFLIMSLKPDQSRALEMFHILVLKLSSKVSKFI